MKTSKIILEHSVPFSIGCAGRARHGKGTLAEILKNWVEMNPKFPFRSQIISFADPLKDFLSSLIGRSEPFRGSGIERTAPIPELRWVDMATDLQQVAAALWGRGAMGDNPTGRQLLQLFGTNVIRQRFIADAWVRIAESRARAYRGVSIIDDVRFPNEAQLCQAGEQPKKRFDLLFKIVRPGVENIVHESETAVDTIPLEAFDAVFVNDGNVQALRTNVLKWLKANVYRNART